MTDLFLKIINMSISAGWLTLVVLFLRLVFKKAPKWVSILLWGIVALRLICPLNFESALSLIPSVQTVSPEIMTDWTPEIDTGIAPLDQTVNPVITSSFAPKPWASANPLQILIPVGANLWILVAICMLLYTAVSYLLLRRKVATAVRYRDNIYQSERVSTPFVLGIIKPGIYLPFSIAEENLSHVIAHEMAHIRRRDYIWKPVGFLILSVHWFNPLVWLSYVLLCRDIELACDEKVIKELGCEQRADYTQALVACSVNRRMIAACPLAFGEVGVKERVKSVMHYKKPAIWMILLAVIACVIVAVCFLTNPLSSVDYLMFTGFNNTAQQDASVYEINLGNRARSGEIIVEQWSDGNCVRSSPVVLTQFDSSIQFTIQQRMDGNIAVGTDIRIESNPFGGSLATYFPYPEKCSGSGYYLSRWEANDRVELTPGEEVILEARSFDCGSGVRPFTCETLISDPEILKTADYMIVIRAMFRDEPLGPEEEMTTQSALFAPEGMSGLWWNLLNNAEFEKTDIKGYLSAGSDLTDGFSSNGDVLILHNNGGFWQFEKGQEIDVSIAFENDGSHMSMKTVGYIYCGDGDAWQYEDTIFSNQNVAATNGTFKVPKDGNYLFYFRNYSSSWLDLKSFTLEWHPNQNTYFELTPTNQVEEKIDNEDLVVLKEHYEDLNGEWVCGEYSYEYRLEISGRMNNAAKNITYIVLSNTDNITFEQTWRAAGFSSNLADYFDPEETVIVGYRMFD